MFDFFPAAKHMTEKNVHRPLHKNNSALRTSILGYLSPGIGQTGTGAPSPMFIVMSLGPMRRFSLPI
jgi:hypothetical protein